MAAKAERLVDREGLPVTCINPDALPVYNEMLLVNMAVRESALSRVQTVLEIDPGFILAHCVLGCMWLSELIPASDPKVSGHVEVARLALEGEELTEREERHVQALLAYTEGQLPTAIDHWAQLLISHPRDLIAVRILFVSCVMIGDFEKMRNVLAGVLPHWHKDMPSYPFILGFFAFSLEQTNYKDRAEDVAREALEMEKRNPWATHALSHVIEEARPAESGVELLTSTREDWLESLIGSHINWHLALYYYLFYACAKFSLRGMLLRDCAGLPVTCAGPEALEALNRLLVAGVSFVEYLFPLARRALEADEHLVLAHCLLGYLQLSSFHPPNSLEVSGHVEVARLALEGEELTEREERHVQALLAYAEGQLPTAIDHWAQLLISHPRDLLATHMLFVSCKMLGWFARARDCLAALLPHWSEADSTHPYLLALYAFGLEETNYYSEAEKMARHALSLQRKVPFACHVMAHVMEETRPADEGVEFLSSCHTHWSDTTYNNHLTWHLALYRLELGDTEAVLNEYDTILVKSVTPDNRLGLLDASSLLWRLNLLGVDVGNRWRQVTDSLKVHIGKHGSTWYDAHLMFSLCHGKLCEETARLALARQMVKSVEDYAESGNSYDSSISEMVGVPCCNALLAYGEERYQEVVSLLVPLRYDLQRLGGSWAQRQVFNLTMIQAATNARDLPMAMTLVAELKAQKPYCKSLSSLFDSLKATYDAEKTTPTDHALSAPDPKKPRTDLNES